MKKIILFNELKNNFAENKDKAKEIRENLLMPTIKDGEKVILDFDKIESTTQSFIHALISDVIRRNGVEAIDKMYFSNCNDTVKGIVTIVVNYMQRKE